MDKRQLDLVRSVVLDELERIAARIERRCEQMKILNAQDAERRRFKSGPFNLTRDNARTARIEAMQDVIAALRGTR
jgi:hypothetical protein